MFEQQILAAAIADKAAYTRLEGVVTPKDFTPPAAFWWKQLTGYYDRDPLAQRADLALLRGLGEAAVSGSRQAEDVLAVLSDLGTVATSVPNVVAAAAAMRRRNTAAELANAILSGAGDIGKERKLLDKLVTLYDTDEAANGTLRYAGPASDLINAVGSANRIPILPRALNERIGGGVLPGHNILVFGRTEVGKSSFAINLAAGFIHGGKKTLYIGNEDALDNLQARLICRITRRPWAEAESDWPGTCALFSEKGGESLLRVAHDQPGSVANIRKAVEDWRPDVLIVDQVINLEGAEENGAARLAAHAIRIRSLISEFNLVGICVAQARDLSDRHNQDSPIWLSSGDVYGSRVGLPAQADLMLGIGGNAEMIARGQRALSIAKNKLHSGPKSRDGLIVEFDPTTSVFK